jgi:ribosomal protein RSM22 (predicted rRNA methylase)
MSLTCFYPEPIEEWWIRQTLNHFGIESLQEREAQLERRIQSLSDLFTMDRSRLKKDYFSNPEYLLAYGLYFFPQTFVRISMILQEVLFRGWKSPQNLSILDLGCGPGAASFSAAFQFRETPATITAIDQSDGALAMMAKLSEDCAVLWPFIKTTSVRDDFWTWSSRAQKKWDLILLSFSLNESSFSITQATDLFANMLTDGGIAIIMEPALKDASETLEKWRDYLVRNSNLHLWGPCLHHQLCPLLQEGEFWCHEVRSWQPPESLRFLNRHLYRQIHQLKFSFLVFGKSEPEKPYSFSFRLISPVIKRKKSFLFTGCTMDGEKKDFCVSGALTNDERNSIKGWKRGDIVTSFPLNP